MKITFMRLSTISMAHYMRLMLILLLAQYTEHNHYVLLLYLNRNMKNDIKFLPSLSMATERSKNRLGSDAFELQIIDRRTDSTGRTQYKIRWPHDNNRIVWEPLINLKKYYAHVKEFQKTYEDRTINWNRIPQALNKRKQQTVQQSDICFGGIWRIKTVRDAGDKTLIFPNPQIQESDSSKSCMVVSQGVNQLDRQKQSTSQAADEFKTKQILTNEQERQLPQLTQQNLQENSSKLNTQEQNRRILKCLRRPVRKNARMNGLANGKRSFFKKCAAQIEDLDQITCIKEISYAPNKQVLATILTSSGTQNQILRDQLRILKPQILLLYYETEFERRLKSFSST